MIGGIMLMRDLGASLIRRWYVTVAGLLMTVGLVAAALALVHPVWESKASIVLLPPLSSMEPGDNPYLMLGGLSPSRDLLGESLSNEKTQERLKAISRTVKYTATADNTSSGPLLVITTDDRTAAGAVAARDELVRMAPLELVALQDSLAIAPRSRIGLKVVTQDPTPLVVGKNRIRAVVAAAGAGLVGTALLVGLIDGLLLRRRTDQVQIVDDGSTQALSLASTQAEMTPPTPEREVAANVPRLGDSRRASAAYPARTMEDADRHNGWSWGDERRQFESNPDDSPSPRTARQS
jgi:hypothetical protein